MEIPIGKIYIRSDDNCFMLSEKGKDKKGKTTWSNLGYYTTLPNLLDGYVTKTLLRSSIRTLQGLQKVLGDIYHTLNKIEAQMGFKEDK